MEEALKSFDDYELTQKLFLEILEDAKNQSNYYGLVKANFSLGYIQKQQGDFGKAVIYYLEGIRYASDADYQNVSNDLVKLLKNTGTIFMKFKNYELAEKYYHQASELASESGLTNEYVRLLYAHSRLLQARGNVEEAIVLLESTFGNFNSISNSTVALIYNKLGGLYSQTGKIQKADATFSKLISFVTGKENLEAVYKTKAYHNLGNLYFLAKDYPKAAEYFEQALELKEEREANAGSIFLTSKDLGEALMMTGRLNEAEFYLLKAEELYNQAKNVADHYEVYKFLGVISKNRGDMESYANYQDLYAMNLEEYVAEREEIEASDKKYNLDLITERYFAMVAEQERNKQIVFYSTIGISSLFFMLVAVFGIFYYRKWKLRKDLEEAIRPLTQDF